MPASILSGITFTLPPLKLETPIIVTFVVSFPLIFAPALFKNSIKFPISGSEAAFSIVVTPSANTAASIMLTVAPTLGNGNLMFAPTNLLAEIVYKSPSLFTLAPRRSNPFK